MIRMIMSAKLLGVVLSLTFMWSSVGHAQEVLQAQQVSPAPPTAAPPLPPAAIQAQNTQGFPTLPPAKPCDKKDIVGMWQLHRLYEVPAGRETLTFTKNPGEYIFFRGNQVVHFERDANAHIPPPELLKNFQQQLQNQLKNPANLVQYVIDQAGFIFYYRNNASFETQACFIVTNQKDGFVPGQMLLMPPQGQSATRLVKIYNKIWTWSPPKK